MGKKDDIATLLGKRKPQQSPIEFLASVFNWKTTLQTKVHEGDQRPFTTGYPAAQRRSSDLLSLRFMQTANPNAKMTEIKNEDITDATAQSTQRMLANFQTLANMPLLQQRQSGTHQNLQPASLPTQKPFQPTYTPSQTPAHLKAQPAGSSMYQQLQQQQQMAPQITTFRKKYDPWCSDLPGFNIDMNYAKAQMRYSQVPGKQFLNEIVPAPKRMRDKFNYQTLEDVQIWVDTPDMPEMANGLHGYRNRNELIKMIKNRAVDRGFRVQLPYGVKNMTIYINCMKYRAPTPGFNADGDEDEEEKGNLFFGKKNQRHTCPFSVIFKKLELAPANKEDKNVHPAVTDLESETALSTGGGIGVYYLAKFRAIHNHPLEPCLMDNNEKSQLRTDPARLLKSGERYLQTNHRWPAENAVLQKFKQQAMRDVIAGQRKMKLAGKGDEGSYLADTNRESASIHSLELDRSGDGRAAIPAAATPERSQFLPTNKQMYMIEPRGNFDPFMIAVEEVEVVKKSAFYKANEVPSEKPRPCSKERADQALETFRELHQRALLLAEKRYRECGIQSSARIGSTNYLHNKTMPFERAPDMTSRENYIAALNSIQYKTPVDDCPQGGVGGEKGTVNKALNVRTLKAEALSSASSKSSKSGERPQQIRKQTRTPIKRVNKRQLMNSAILNPEEEFVYVQKNLRRNTVRLTVIKSALIDLPSDDEEDKGGRPKEAPKKQGKKAIQQAKLKIENSSVSSSSSNSSDRGADLDSQGNDTEHPPVVHSQTQGSEIVRGHNSQQQRTCTSQTNNEQQQRQTTEPAKSQEATAPAQLNDAMQDVSAAQQIMANFDEKEEEQNERQATTIEQKDQGVDNNNREEMDHDETLSEDDDEDEASLE